MAVIRSGKRETAPAPGGGPDRAGFTLAESVVALLIVSIMLAAALNMVGSAARGRQVHVAQSRGPALAGHLMSEVLHARYAEPDGGSGWGPDVGESGASRRDFDDVDDYHNWTASPPEMKNGTVVDGYDGWTRRVRVSYADPADPNGDSMVDSGIKRILVTVVSDKGEETSLVALRSEDSAYDHDFAEGTTLIGSVSLSLKAGEHGSAIATATNLLNEVQGEASVADEPQNNPPQAVAQANPLSGVRPLTVWFTAEASSDPDPDDVLSCTWDFGDSDGGSGVTTNHTYWSPGTYTVTLTVSDQAGATDTATLTIRVWQY